LKFNTSVVDEEFEEDFDEHKTQNKAQILIKSRRMSTNSRKQLYPKVSKC
jgi:hypothetical protein